MKTRHKSQQLRRLVLYMVATEFERGARHWPGLRRMFARCFDYGFEVDVRGSFGGICRPGHGPSAVIRRAINAKSG